MVGYLCPYSAKVAGEGYNGLHHTVRRWFGKGNGTLQKWHFLVSMLDFWSFLDFFVDLVFVLFIVKYQTKGFPGIVADKMIYDLGGWNSWNPLFHGTLDPRPPPKVIRTYRNCKSKNALCSWAGPPKNPRVFDLLGGSCQVVSG